MRKSAVSFSLACRCGKFQLGSRWVRQPELKAEELVRKAVRDGNPAILILFVDCPDCLAAKHH